MDSTNHIFLQHTCRKFCYQLVMYTFLWWIVFQKLYLIPSVLCIGIY